MKKLHLHTKIRKICYKGWKTKQTSLFWNNGIYICIEYKALPFPLLTQVTPNPRLQLLGNVKSDTLWNPAVGIHQLYLIQILQKGNVVTSNEAPKLVPDCIFRWKSTGTWKSSCENPTGRIAGKNLCLGSKHDELTSFAQQQKGSARLFFHTLFSWWSIYMLIIFSLDCSYSVNLLKRLFGRSKPEEVLEALFGGNLASKLWSELSCSSFSI